MKIMATQLSNMSPILDPEYLEWRDKAFMEEPRYDAKIHK